MAWQVSGMGEEQGQAVGQVSGMGEEQGQAVGQVSGMGEEQGQAVGRGGVGGAGLTHAQVRYKPRTCFTYTCFLTCLGSPFPWGASRPPVL